MPVVSNTSPILGLAAARCLHLLRQQFEHLEIPPAVFSELKTPIHFRGARQIAQALKEGWISQVEVQDSLRLPFHKAVPDAALPLEITPTFTPTK